jgi:hypothetical protein
MSIQLVLFSVNPGDNLHGSAYKVPTGLTQTISNKRRSFPSNISIHMVRPRVWYLCIIKIKIKIIIINIRTLRRGSRDRAVGITTGNGLDDRGQEISLLHVIQIASEAHSASYPMG